MTELKQPLTLPCGAVLPNRILKSAMSETLATDRGAPDERLNTLYARWARGGLGLAITGNVMVDRHALGEPGNVVLEDDRSMDAMRAWVRAGQGAGMAMWAQLNHPGRQAPRFLNAETVAPSAVPFEGPFATGFQTPRELTGTEVVEIVARFGRSAALAQQAGFAGVQIHGAHGYLVSQFLSPHTNRRTDQWGGSAENRQRFVLEVYRAMRAAVGPRYPISIKLNSADFQKGGFTEQESLAVVQALAAQGIDLVEISGGTYEAPAMAVGTRSAREAYFLDYAERIRSSVSVPLAVTGGFRTREGMVAAVGSGACDMVGLARVLAIDPDAPRKLLSGEPYTSAVRPIKSGIKYVDNIAMLEVQWYENQLARMAQGQEPQPGMHPVASLLASTLRLGRGAWRTRRARG